MSKRRVVVTGLGVLAPGAIGAEAFGRLLSEGRSGISTMTQYDVGSFHLKAAGEIKDFEPKNYVENRKSLKVMSRDIQLAVAAAKLVMEDSGLLEKKPDPTRFGVSLGAAFINTSIDELGPAIRLSTDDTGKFNIQKYGAQGLSSLFPLWLLKYLPNMLACHISIIYDAQGPSNSITTACAASTQAIGEAYRIIERGDADLFLAGGADSKLDPLSWVRFEMLGLFTKNGAAPEKAVRPFDRLRDGFVAAEGAALVILEELEHAKKRGAKIYGELVGFGTTANPSPILRKITPQAQRLSMQMALSDAGLSIDDVDYIQAHALGLPETDRLETEAIKELFGKKAYRIPVSSIKGATGFTSAAAGGLGVASTLMAMRDGVIPPTLNYENPDPDCDLDYVPIQPRRAQIRTALVNTFSLIGQNAVLAIRRYE